MLGKIFALTYERRGRSISLLAPNEKDSTSLSFHSRRTALETPYVYNIHTKLMLEFFPRNEEEEGEVTKKELGCR